MEETTECAQPGCSDSVEGLRADAKYCRSCKLWRRNRKGEFKNDPVTHRTTCQQNGCDNPLAYSASPNTKYCPRCKKWRDSRIGEAKDDSILDTRVCADCHTSIAKTHRNTVYCDGCAELRSKKNLRERIARYEERLDRGLVEAYEDRQLRIQAERLRSTLAYLDLSLIHI